MITSMTGFAGAAGAIPGSRYAWEIRTVNAKGLDLRLRMPAGFDALEAEARRRIAAQLTRGTCHSTLTVTREAAPARVRVNADLLADLVAALGAIALPPTIRPASLDALIGIRGVVEIVEPEVDPAAAEALRAACLASLDEAVTGLCAMRASEGRALAAALNERLDTIARLKHDADHAPQRRPEAVRARLSRTVAALAERHELDSDRLHQEAVLLAAKADVREELDRLAAHIAACRDLLAAGGPVGRRLDFLAQELAREANTFCAKSGDAALTAIGLELRVEIEQFREQVQNVE